MLRLCACPSPKHVHTALLRNTAYSPYPAPFYQRLSNSLKDKTLQCVSSLQLWYRYTPVVPLSGSPSLAISLSTFQSISCEDIPFDWYMVAGVSQVSSRIKFACWHLYIEDLLLHGGESVILAELINNYLSLE